MIFQTRGVASQATLGGGQFLRGGTASWQPCHSNQKSCTALVVALTPLSEDSPIARDLLDLELVAGSV